jgi:hypothetical protein
MALPEIEAMSWRAIGDTDTNKILHLRLCGDDFAPFWEFPFAREIEAKGTGQSMSEFLEVCGLMAPIASCSENKINCQGQLQPIAHSLGWHVFQALNKNKVRLV